MNDIVPLIQDNFYRRLNKKPHKFKITPHRLHSPVSAHSQKFSDIEVYTQSSSMDPRVIEVNNPFMRSLESKFVFSTFPF